MKEHTSDNIFVFVKILLISMVMISLMYVTTSLYMRYDNITMVADILNVLNDALSLVTDILTQELLLHFTTIEMHTWYNII